MIEQAVLTNIEDEAQTPVNDTLFMSIVTKMEACELQHGWACEKCNMYRECEKLLDTVADLSCEYKLNSQNSRKYVEMFMQIRIKVVCALPLSSSRQAIVPPHQKYNNTG